VYRIDDVVLWVSKSDEVLKLAKFLAKLFPSATFHLLAVVPRMRTRFFLTSLYHEVAKSIAEEALEAVEKELTRCGIQRVRKVFEKGSPLKVVKMFVEEVSADLLGLAVAIEMEVEEIVDSPIPRVLNTVRIPVMVYTALSKVGEVPSSIAIVSKGRGLGNALGIALSLARSGGLDLELFLTTRLSPDELDRLTLFVRSHGVKLSVDFVEARREELVANLLHATKIHDLVIVERTVFETRSIFARKKIGELESILVASSHSPILFV